MPQIGHCPGSSEVIKGCIGLIYLGVSAARWVAISSEIVSSNKDVFFIVITSLQPESATEPGRSDNRPAVGNTRFDNQITPSVHRAAWKNRSCPPEKRQQTPQPTALPAVEWHPDKARSGYSAVQVRPVAD